MNRSLARRLAGASLIALGTAAAGQDADDAARRQARLLLAPGDTLRSCLPLALPRPEAEGLPGIAPRPVPGQHAITYLLRTSEAAQARRDQLLEQLDHLAARGLLASSAVQVDTPAGPRAALRYQLTWPGYGALAPDGNQELCLQFGRWEAGPATDLQATGDDVAGLAIHEATVTFRPVDMPAWLRSADTQRLFPALAEATRDRAQKVRIARTPRGWRALADLQMELEAAARGRPAEAGTERLARWQPPQVPGLPDAAAALARHAAEPAGSGRRVACLPLRLQRGGDDRNAPRGEGVPFTFTVHDLGERPGEALRPLLASVHVLDALEAMGLARHEVLRLDGAAAGVRYAVRPEATPALGLDGGACVPVGSGTMEILAVIPHGAGARVLLRDRLQAPPAWARPLVGRLPALRSMVEEGLAYEAALAWAPGRAGEPRAWRVQGLRASFPQLDYATLPPGLEASLPRTAANLPLQGRAQPGDVPPFDPQAEAAALRRAEDMAGRAAAQARASAASGSARTFVSAVPPEAAEEHRAAPYPAGGAPVHVLTMYEGAYADGPRRAREHPEGRVDLAVSVPDAVLLLAAHEPVEWRITATRPVRQVIAIGYYPQRVTFGGPGQPAIATPGWREVIAATGLQGIPFASRWTGDRNQLVDVAQLAQALTGQGPASFQAPQGKDRNFVVDAGTVAFQLPRAQAPQDATGPVRLNASFEQDVQGTTLRRGMAGAHTDAWSDRAFSAGRGYFEATLRVTGSLAAHTHANVGLCEAREERIEHSADRARVLRHGEQRLYQDGDVFGLAADFERGRLYVRVNGRWLQGEPGSAGGIPLEKDKAYRACAFAAGTTTGEVRERGRPRSDSTWELNFGGRPFQAAPPKGFVPLQGS